MTLRPEDITTDGDAFALVRAFDLLDGAAAVVILPGVPLIVSIADTDNEMTPGDDVGDAVEDAILGMDALDGAGLGWIVWPTPPGDLRARAVSL